MFENASNAAPSVPATQPSITPPKEQTMSNTSPSAESAVAGSSVSTSSTSPKDEVVDPTATSAARPGAEPAPSTPRPASTGKEVKQGAKAKGAPAAGDPPATPAPGEEAKKKRKKAIPFNPSSSLAAGQEVVDRAKGHPGRAIIAAAQAVLGLMQALIGARSALAVAQVEVAHAKSALERFAAGVQRALTPVIAVLRKDTVGGRELVRQCQTKDPLTTGKAILGRLAEGSLGVNPALVLDLQHACDLAAPLVAARAGALEQEETTQAAYNQAKARLDDAVSLLRARLSSDRAESKWSALVPADVAPPPPQKKPGKKKG